MAQFRGWGWAQIAAIFANFGLLLSANAQSPDSTPVVLNAPVLLTPEAPAARPSDKPPEKATGVPAPTSPIPDDGLLPASSVLYDSFHPDGKAADSLFDSFHQPGEGGKHWYEKLSIRGYSQFRYGRAISRAPDSAPPSLLGDRSIGDRTGTFSIRRARLILSADVSERVLVYFQSDFANGPDDRSSNTYFAQIRDLYADISLDDDKVNRLRVGQSKIPWGFEEMQSSGNRVPLDRSDAIDSGDSPNQRDLGVFYYWTPVEKQKLLKDLVDGGLKGTGNYGIFAFGVYDGEGGSQLDQNRSLHAVARVTWPFLLASGQAVEVSLQGFAGRYVARGTPIHPLGVGDAVTPAGVGPPGIREERLAASFVWYPQPIGFQAEWNVGEGPGLNDAQTAVERRSLSGGYVMAMYKYDTARTGIFIPFTRYQHYRGGYRSIANSPYGTHDEYDLGVEWQIRKELELVVEYGFVNGVSLDPVADAGERSYRNFHGDVLRCQMQVNY
ncbi:porin [Limnoglobus roseus]|uniref:Porin n=1 Tax=Limnoglobus roseus TaxID=2598579 RepID=A0A5C1AAY5_9BACT|nr:porin [Limnoglobus roseus]QEL15735.1 hypothetical protein PX52LOC_02670 [Limnoglobus roseus]